MRATRIGDFRRVKVDEHLAYPLTRVSAGLGGRNSYTKTATTRIMGGVVWFIAWLCRGTAGRPQLGRIMNPHRECHVPGDSDVHDSRSYSSMSTDEIINTLGVKGVASRYRRVAAAIAKRDLSTDRKTRGRIWPITLVIAAVIWRPAS